MTTTELEVRLESIEQELSRLASKVNRSSNGNVNAWIDQIHGTFRNDAAYREAAKAGRNWRKAQRPTRLGLTKKTSGK
jgi:hypothetical protein